MTELERIEKNTNGEPPKGEKTIIRVSRIENPAEVLEICKQTVTVFLENKALLEDDPAWEDLIPTKITSFINQLDEEDYENDEVLHPLDSLIYDLKRFKEWEWYSSKLISGGFEITVTKSFNPRFVWLIHCQNIPLSKLWIMDDRFGDYGIPTIKDVTTYKEFS